MPNKKKCHPKNIKEAVQAFVAERMSAERRFGGIFEVPHEIVEQCRQAVSAFGDEKSSEDEAVGSVSEATRWLQNKQDAFARSRRGMFIGVAHDELERARRQQSVEHQQSSRGKLPISMDTDLRRRIEKQLEQYEVLVRQEFFDLDAASASFVNTLLAIEEITSEQARIDKRREEKAAAEAERLRRERAEQQRAEREAARARKAAERRRHADDLLTLLDGQQVEEDVESDSAVA